jgi:DNA-binding LacI/PurR family transcriptional regulator
MAVTLRDIARHLGISHATVSFVLNNRTDMGITEATRQRVLSAAQELGYKPNRAARALTTGRTDMIAVCLPSSVDGYYASLLHHFQNAIGAGPYEVVVWESKPCLLSGRKLPVDLNVDGYLALDVDLDDGIFTGESGERKPGVNVGMVPRQGWDNIRIEVEEAAIQALESLCAQGCKKLAYVYPAKANAKPRDGLYKAFHEFKASGVTLQEIPCTGKERYESVQTIREYIPTASYASPMAWPSPRIRLSRSLATGSRPT